MSLVLDAGALIAIERRSRRVVALVDHAQRAGLDVRTSAAVVAQVWRGDARQAILAVLLAGTDVTPLDHVAARATGAVLASSGTRDIVDAHLVMIVRPGDDVVTSDGGDIRRLLDDRRIRAQVVDV
jgi:hypothetical protein